jgi:pimeloyl-ACP methyl ester carboxylesterase
VKVQVDDVHLYFDVTGAKRVPDGPTMVERPTIVFLHGGPGFDHSIWADTMGPVSEWAQVIVYDHRGNGRSDAGPREKWTLEQWGDDVVGFCDALGIVKPVVVGSSFGGFVALSYAGRHPDHPGKLILDSTSARLVIERMFPVFERLGGPAAVDAAKRFWTDPSAENLRDYGQVCMPLYSRRSDAMEKQANSIGRTLMNTEVLSHFIHDVQPTYDQTALLAKIICPTLVLSGDDDPVTPTACSEEIVAGLAHDIVRFERYPAGHGMFGELPEQANALLREFVES